MVKQAELIEIEIDGPKNQNLYFRPIREKLRGRFDLHRVKEPNAGKLMNRWPEPIPGQRLTLNLETGEAFIVEPLHDPSNAAMREKIEATGEAIAPERREVGTVDLATWVYWMKGAVDSGSARLVSGKFPEKIEGKPQIRFHSKEQVDPASGIEATLGMLAEQNAAILKVLAKIAEK